MAIRKVATPSDTVRLQITVAETCELTNSGNNMCTYQLNKQYLLTRQNLTKLFTRETQCDTD